MLEGIANTLVDEIRKGMISSCCSTSQLNAKFRVKKKPKFGETKHLINLYVPMLPKFPLGVEFNSSLKYSQLLLASTRLNRSLVKDPFLKLENDFKR